MTEIIIELTDFPLYFASNFGNIYSEKTGKMKKMKPGKDKKTGYLKVCLYKDGKSYKLVHRLVCETFLKKIKDKPFVDHINRIKTDNRLENLRWVNGRENNINTGISNRNTSGTKGVCFRKTTKTWCASIYIESNKMKQKYFKTKECAIKWRSEMEQKYYKIEEVKEDEYPGRNWRDEGEAKYLFENF
jgi:hypothetical protein